MMLNSSNLFFCFLNFFPFLMFCLFVCLCLSLLLVFSFFFFILKIRTLVERKDDAVFDDAQHHRATNDGDVLRSHQFEY